MTRHLPISLVSLLLLSGCDERQQEELPAIPLDGPSAILDGSSVSFDELFPLREHFELEESENALVVSPEITIAASRLLVADTREAQVRIHDLDGKLRLAFGQRGRGPGEMTAPVRAIAVSDSQILVVERDPSRPLALWQLSSEEEVLAAEFVGYVETDELVEDLGIPNDARWEPSFGLFLATYIRAERAGATPLGVTRYNLHQAGDRSSLGEPIAFDLTVDIQPDLLVGFNTAGWTSIDVGSRTLVAAAAPSDTIHALDLTSGIVRSFPIPSRQFRRMPPIPDEAASQPRARLDWMSSFSTVGNLFLLGQNTIVVQFQDFVNQVPRHNLVGFTMDGAPLFQVLGTPRMLAWDPRTRRFLGARQDAYALPNQLTWYGSRWEELR